MNNCDCNGVYNIRREQLDELQQTDPVAYQIWEIMEISQWALRDGRVDEKGRHRAAEALSAAYDWPREKAYHWIDTALARAPKSYRQPWLKRWISGGWPNERE